MHKTLAYATLAYTYGTLGNAHSAQTKTACGIAIFPPAA